MRVRVSSIAFRVPCLPFSTVHLAVYEFAVDNQRDRDHLALSQWRPLFLRSASPARSSANSLRNRVAFRPRIHDE